MPTLRTNGISIWKFPFYLQRLKVTRSSSTISPTHCRPISSEQEKEDRLDNLTEILFELKSEILNGTDPENAITIVAKSFAVSTAALRSRAVRSFGDLGTIVKREKLLVAGTSPEMQRKTADAKRHQEQYQAFLQWKYDLAHE